MSTFEERIAKAVTEKMNDGTVEELISEAVTKALKSSIEEQFRWNGEAKKVIDEKVKEVMTPAIERVSLDDHVVKLDAVLTEIINSTNLVDNKKILGNFKSLMTETESEWPIKDARIHKNPNCKFSDKRTATEIECKLVVNGLLEEVRE